MKNVRLWLPVEWLTLRAVAKTFYKVAREQVDINNGGYNYDLKRHFMPLSIL